MSFVGMLTLMLLTFSYLFGAVTSERGFPKIDERGNLTENYSSRGAKLRLASHKSRFTMGEKIPITVRITNEGFYPITFYLHQNIAQNFSFVATRDDGKSLPIKNPEYYARRPKYPDAYFMSYTATNHLSRALVLQPGESYEKVLYLDEFVDIPSDIKKLGLKAYFYVNPEQAPQVFLLSENELVLFFDPVSPSLATPKKPRIEEVPLSLTPQEVVFLVLNAEYHKDWKNYLKYLSLRDLIADYPDFAQAYYKADAEQKTRVLQNFRDFLASSKNHRLIRFEVLSDTESDGIRAKVKVKAQREIEGFRREFYYTYYLTKQDNFWQVTGIETQLLR
ncbi:MAG: hypothetical protein NZM25_05215 [Leptospiraceae bacterium]|nr:hypothetical protein [Leptospiraceae bacterium]MDW8305592.1 hypothetical protein [Leptospiraceae bacterium]